MLKYIPGFIAALAAFAILKLVGWLTSLSLATELLVFIVAYLVIAFSVDKAFTSYGSRK